MLLISTTRYAHKVIIEKTTLEMINKEDIEKPLETREGLIIIPQSLAHSKWRVI